MTAYVVRWRRAGCIAVTLYLFLASVLSIAVYGEAAVGERQLPWWLVPAFAVGVFVGLLRLHKLLTRRRVPICPHCGADTNPSFRVCHACGREK